MFEQHFGLLEDPFGTSPDPRFLFFSPSHREALAGLMHGILNRKGAIALIGEPGTGKTSLLRRVLNAVGGSTSFIVNPAVDADEFTKLAMLKFGIDDVPSSRAEQLVRLETFLEQANQDGLPSILVVDEAQRLGTEVLEEIRTLTNLEGPSGRLLQIVLAGQNELRSTLNRPELRQLKQRIALRLVLQPLSSMDEVERYVRHRWQVAGATSDLPFSSSAIESIRTYSSGIPRVVNVICDSALTLAVAEGAKSIRDEHILSVAEDLDLVEEPLAASPIPITKQIPVPVPDRSQVRAKAKGATFDYVKR